MHLRIQLFRSLLHVYPEQQVFVPFTLQNVIIAVTHVFLHTFHKVNSGFAQIWKLGI